MLWFSLESRVAVELKYVLSRLKAGNDLSPTALVAGMTSNSFPRVRLITFCGDMKGLHEDYQIIDVKF